MRVTESMIVSDFLRNVSQNRNSINVLQLQLSTNKKVNKPSDDPVSNEAILRFQSAIQRNDIYKKNIADSISSLESTFDNVDQLNQTMNELKQVLLAASNTEEPSMLSTYGQQVDGLLKRMTDVANYKFNGKYLFAGTKTMSQPYSFDGSKVTVNPKGVDGQIMVDIGGPEREQININGSELFQGTAVFDTIIKMRDDLKNIKKPLKDQIDTVDKYIDNINNVFGKVGAISERFKAVQAQADNESVRLEAYLGQENDIDIAETTVKLTQAQTNLDAAFKSWSGVLQKTLFNFLS